MKVDLDSIRPGYTIRSDIFGFYLCSVTEAVDVDEGINPSAGCDLRSHWETLEEAVSALQNWRPAEDASPGAGLALTARGPLTPDAISQVAFH